MPPSPKDYALHALVIGLVIAFGVGYMVGAAGRATVVEAYPRNYDPARAVESQGIKVAEDNAKFCFDLLAHHLEQPKCPTTQAPAH